VGKATDRPQANGQGSRREQIVKQINRIKSEERGFTLIEIVVVLAILGILAALLVPRFADVFSKGDQTAFDTDVAAVEKAVQQFKVARHDAPGGSSEWGAGSNNKRIYPTEDGEVGDIELDLANTDTNGNYRIVQWTDGVANTGAVAASTNVIDSLVWIGLLVNEPNDNGTSAQQQTTGHASPQDDEEGEFLTSFPDSAAVENTTFDPSGSATTGSYWYVLLHNGEVAPAYENAGTYYAGYNQAYP
jgi:prepilin-type N-terminal cleavage/methylation domain-containing protein